MTHEGVILPKTSLFLVDRGWNARPKNSRSSHVQGTNPEHVIRGENRTLDGSAIKVINRPWALQNGNGQGGADSDNKRHASRNQKTSKSFEFVNATTPGHAQDPKLKRLVKSHVKSGIKRGPNSKTLRPKPLASSKSPEEQTDLEPNPKIEEQTPMKLDLAISGASSPLYGNETSSLLMKPRSHSLLDYYFQVSAPSWYPLEAYLAYNPLRVKWFSLAIRDETWFRSVLFASAAHLATKNGGQDDEEPIELVMPIFRHLNQQLQDNSTPSESTIGIVSCLAMVEISVRNYQKWKVHMNGIKEMVRLRGGLCNVDEDLQVKIARADIEGASDAMQEPNLSVLPRLAQPVHSNLPDSNPYSVRMDLISALDQSGVSSKLQSSFIDLDRLSHTLSHAVNYKDITIDPRSLDEDIVLIHHDILALLIPTISFQNYLSPSESSTIDLNEAAGIAALLYAKSLTRPIHSIPIHPRPIVQRLISSLSKICLQEELSTEDSREESPTSSVSIISSSTVPDFSLPFLIWLHFMGGISSRGMEAEFLASGILHLIDRGKLSGDLRYDLWEGVKGVLSEILWFPLVHDEPGKRLWEMAMERSRVVEQVDQESRLDDIYVLP